MTRLRRLGVAPAIVDTELIETIRTGGIEIVPAVQAFSGRAVRLAGGSTIEPDAVICATGYRRGSSASSAGLDVLDEHGRPRATGEHPAAPFASSVTSPDPQGSATWPSRPNAPPRQSPQNSATRVGALESPSSVVETYAGHGAGLNGRRLTSGCRPRHKADTTSPWSLPVQQVPSHRRRARRSRPCRCSRGRSSGGLLPDCRGGS